MTAVAARDRAPRPALDTLVIDPVRDPRWAQLVEGAPAATAFHHPAWVGLLRAHYRFPISACCIAAADGGLVAGLPVAEVGGGLRGRRLVALPFSDVCPPLVARGAGAPASAALAAALDALCSRRRLGLEVHGSGDALLHGAPGARFHHHVVPLERDLGAVVGRFRRPQLTRGVRRARREGLTVERRTDVRALAAFYRLHVATRARLGVPTQPRRFVLRLADAFADGLGFVLLVRRGELPVAGAVLLTHRDVLTYKWGASDARFLRARPNNLLFMEAITWGCEHGVRAFDLGRTDPGQEGLRAFKLAWGAEERELRHRHLPTAPAARGAARGRAALGAVLRHAPPVTSRLVGELLYRRAA